MRLVAPLVYLAIAALFVLALTRCDFGTPPDCIEGKTGMICPDKR